MIVIDKIKYGRYYIIEKEAPEGYQINNEKMYFEITEDGQVVKSVMKDEIIEVPNTEKNETKELIVGGVILILLGAGAVIYANKKTKEEDLIKFLINKDEFGNNIYLAEGDYLLKLKK